jgi:hypothetical protein
VRSAVGETTERVEVAIRRLAHSDKDGTADTYEHT